MGVRSRARARMRVRGEGVDEDEGEGVPKVGIKRNFTNKFSHHRTLQPLDPFACEEYRHLRSRARHHLRLRDNEWNVRRKGKSFKVL